MKLRHRAEKVMYASDSEEDEASIASDQDVVVMNQRRCKAKAGSGLCFSAAAEAGSLLRYAQPNIKNTDAALSPLPEIPAMVDDSDEDFMEATVSQRKRSTQKIVRKNEGSPRAKRNISCRLARKSYKEITSSEEDDVQDHEPTNDVPDLSTFSFKKDLAQDDMQKVLVPGRRRLVKAVTSPQEIDESPCVLSEDDTNELSGTEAIKPLRKSKKELSKLSSTSMIKEQVLIKSKVNSSSLADVGDAQESTALDLHANAYGLCTLEGANACKMVKRAGKIEKILAVQNRGTDSAVYCIKECGKSYRNVSAVKEVLLKSNCPQLHRNFLKRMDELDRINGNPGEMKDAPAFCPLYLQIERVITKEERKGSRKYYLVKWRGLPYSEATWELEADLTFKEDQAAVHRYVQIHSRTLPGVPLTNDGKLVFEDGRVLRDYQEKGLAWMDHNFLNRVNCILADEMGLGKTMQAVSMLQNLRVKRKCKGPFLVIAPVSTLGHWQREVESLTNMNCVVFSGSADDRKIIKDYEFYYPKSRNPKFNVLLTSFEILMKDQVFLSKHEWQYVVVDEAHRLKSKCSKTTCCLKQLSIIQGGLLLLTGTPIQNNTKEIFSLLNILDSQQFSSEEEFLLKYGDLRNADQVKDLQDNVLRPRLLRRLKEDVEKSIPLKEETIIWVELTKEQRRYYRAILENRISDLLKGSQSNNMPNLRNVAMELRKLCNHPFLCNGLQEDMSSKLNLQEADKSSEALCMSSGKMMLLEKLLPMLKKAGHRVLLFSQFAIMLDLLEDYLISKDYSYERIDGSVCGSERQAAIDRYSAKDSNTFLFLLSTRAGGLGITLTAADTCIIYDSDWNPQNDLQAMARCHRIGQKKDVRIYRLITKDTYEQHLFECSSRKYGLDEAILGSMQGAITDDDYNANIENLLKKGAYSILKEDGEAEAAAFHAQNIEQILESRTEKRLVGGRGQNTFSVATFISNPVVDSMVNEEPALDRDPQQFWHELLPEACNAASNDNQFPVLTSCGPRKRQVVNYREGRANSEPELSDEEHETFKSRRHRAKRKNSQELGATDDIKQWTEKELKQLESSLFELGANRTEDIITEARLQHHGIQEVQQLCDVLVQLCWYFQASNLVTTNIPHSEPPSANAASNQNIVRDHSALNVIACSTDQTQDWNASSFSNTSGEVPTSVDIHFPQDNKDMETAKDEKKKPDSSGLIMHAPVGGIEFPTIPPYAEKALGSKVLTKRLEKKATRYLHMLQEREMLARALSEGRVVPPYVKRLKRLPIWWSEAEDADLLRGAHKHGHHSFCKIREDKALCFSSKLELLKSGIQEREDQLCQDVTANSPETKDEPPEPLPCPDQDIWPQDAVLGMRLRQLIQALRSPLSLSNRLKDKALDECAPKSSVDERERTTALVSKKHPHNETIPSKRLVAAHGVSASSLQPSMELCSRNIPALSPHHAKAQKLVPALCPLPIIKTKSPHVQLISKTKPLHDKKSRGKENLYFREVLDVPNTSSEGSGDEDFQGQHLKTTAAAPIANAQWDAPPGNAYSIHSIGASLLEKPPKEAHRLGSMSIATGLMPGCGKGKTYSRTPLKVAIITAKECRENKWPSTANVGKMDCAMERANQREPLLELNAAKRKTCIEAPLLSNKKHKEAGKQQTLHGFLAQKVAPRQGTL